MARKRVLAVFAVVSAVSPVAARAAEGLPSPATLQIGSAYVAKQLCSCLFVAGRTETSCRAEFKPQVDLAKVAVDRSVLPERARVSVTLLATTAEATYSRHYGCVLSK